MSGLVQVSDKPVTLPPVSFVQRGPWPKETARYEPPLAENMRRTRAITPGIARRLNLMDEDDDIPGVEPYAGGDLNGSANTAHLLGQSGTGLGSIAKPDAAGPQGQPIDGSRPPPVAPPAMIPVNTLAPVVTFSSLSIGAAGVLTCTPGTWSNNPVSFTYLWGSTAFGGFPTQDPVFSLGPGMQGLNIFCVVVANNGVGAASAMSNTVGPVTP